MIKKLLVTLFGRKGEPQYIDSILDLFYEKDGRVVTLQFSESPHPRNMWAKAVRGKNAVKLVSDGNGYDVTLSGGPYGKPKCVRLDYCQASYLLKALKVAEKASNKHRKAVQTDRVVDDMEALEEAVPMSALEKQISLEDVLDFIETMPGQYGPLVERELRRRMRAASKV
jgi:hypothetical protein